MSDEMQKMLSGSSAGSEVRTLDPHMPQWITAQAAAGRLEMPMNTVYNWIYRQKIAGCKKAAGKLMIPQAEMNRLIGLKDDGALEAAMRAGQGSHRKPKKTATAKAKKPAGKAARVKKHGPGPVTPKPAATKPAQAPIASAALISDIAAVKMPTEKLAELMNLHGELVRQFDRIGLRVNLTPY